MKYLILLLFATSVSAQAPQMRYGFMGTAGVFVDQLTSDVLVCGERNHIFRCYRIAADAEPEYFQKGDNGLEPAVGS